MADRRDRPTHQIARCIMRASARREAAVERRARMATGSRTDQARASRARSRSAGAAPARQRTNATQGRHRADLNEGRARRGVRRRCVIAVGAGRVPGVTGVPAATARRDMSLRHAAELAAGVRRRRARPRRGSIILALPPEGSRHGRRCCAGSQPTEPTTNRPQRRFVACSYFALSMSCGSSRRLRTPPQPCHHAATDPWRAGPAAAHQA